MAEHVAFEHGTEADASILPLADGSGGPFLGLTLTCGGPSSGANQQTGPQANNNSSDES